jgi:OmpA-OmpF porin, OOP family
LQLRESGDIAREEWYSSVMVRPLGTALVLCCAAGWAAPASVPAFDLERLVWNSGGSATLFVQSGDGLPKGALRLTLPTHYQHAALRYSEGGRVIGNVVGSRITSVLSFAIGVLDGLEVALQVPVVWFQAGDDLLAYDIVSPRRLAIGAAQVQARFTPIRQAGGAPLDVGFSLALGIPIGDAMALTRDPGWGLALVPRLGAGRRFGWFRLGAELGALIRGAVELSPESARVSDQIGTNLTAALVGSAHYQALAGELALRFHLPLTAVPASAELQAAIRYGFFDQRFEVGLFGGAGFGVTPGTPAFRVGLSVGWTPRFTW